MQDSRNKLIFPFLLVFFEMATYLSSDMYLPALPTVMRDFSISHREVQWTLTAWFMGAVSVQLILGPISDRFGRKTVLCSGGILFVISTLVCALATHFHTLVIARFFQGTGVCFMAVPGYASIHESFEQKGAIKLLALMGSIAVLAPAFGPLLGSVILMISTWRSIFGFLVIWATLSILLLFIYMPETLPAKMRHPLNLKVILKNYGLVFTHSKFMLTITIFGMLFCGFITWIAAGPFLVMDQFKESSFMFGVYQTVIFTSFIISNHLVKVLIEKMNIKKLIFLGLLICFCVSLLSLLSSLMFPHFLLGMIIFYIIYAFGAGLAFAPLNRLAIEAVNAPMGMKMAVFSTLMSGFATIGTILVGLFYQGTLLSIAIIIFGVMLITMILIVLLKYD